MPILTFSRRFYRYFIRFFILLYLFIVVHKCYKGPLNLALLRLDTVNSFCYELTILQNKKIEVTILFILIWRHTRVRQTKKQPQGMISKMCSLQANQTKTTVNTLRVQQVILLLIPLLLIEQHYNAVQTATYLQRIRHVHEAHTYYFSAAVPTILCVDFQSPLLALCGSSGTLYSWVPEA